MALRRRRKRIGSMILQFNGEMHKLHVYGEMQLHFNLRRTVIKFNEGYYYYYYYYYFYYYYYSYYFYCSYYYYYFNNLYFSSSSFNHFISSSFDLSSV